MKKKNSSFSEDQSSSTLQKIVKKKAWYNYNNAVIEIWSLKQKKIEVNSATFQETQKTDFRAVGGLLSQPLLITLAVQSICKGYVNSLSHYITVIILKNQIILLGILSCLWNFAKSVNFFSQEKIPVHR